MRFILIDGPKRILAGNRSTEETVIEMGALPSAVAQGEDRSR
jgi:hypothetical protein